MTRDNPRQGAGAPSFRPAAFLDRDGVLNRDSGFVYKPEHFFWLEGAKESVRFLNEQGYLVLVVTNQSGVAQGFYEERDVRALHDWMNSELGKAGGRVDGFYYCPHHPQGSRDEYRKICRCRKPAPGLLHQAIRDWPIDTARSFLIGDNERDLKAGEAAGIASYLFKGGNLLEMVWGLVETDSASKAET